MKYMNRQEFDVQIERIVYAEDLATLLLSRDGLPFELVTERAKALALQPYVGSNLLLTVEAWLEFSWTPIGDR